MRANHLRTGKHPFDVGEMSSQLLCHEGPSRSTVSETMKPDHGACVRCFWLNQYCFERCSHRTNVYRMKRMSSPALSGKGTDTF